MKGNVEYNLFIYKAGALRLKRRSETLRQAGITESLLFLFFFLQRLLKNVNGKIFEKYQ